MLSINRLYLLLATAMMPFVLLSCSIIDPVDEDRLPEVHTMPVINVTLTTAYCGGRVYNAGGTEIDNCGICWGYESSPTIGDYNDFYSYDGYGNGDFMRQMTYLQVNKTYYVRAYATNNAGTAYGEEYSFRTVMDSAVAPCSPVINRINNNGQIYDYTYVHYGSNGGYCGDYIIRGNASYSDLNIEFSEPPVTGKYVTAGYSSFLASGECAVIGVFNNYLHVGEDGDTVYVTVNSDGYSASFCNLKFYSSALSTSFTSDGNLTAGPTR